VAGASVRGTRSVPVAAAERGEGQAPRWALELLHEVRAIRRAVERGRGPRDSFDAALLRAVFDVFDVTLLTAAQVWAHRAADADLRDALDNAGVDSTRELGILFGRMAGHECDGLRLERVEGYHREGAQWRVRVSVSQDSQAEY
jgi:hypothetical protein